MDERGVCVVIVEAELTVIITQSGVLDITVFPGPTFGQVMEAYTRLTGRPILPPMFALAYHQCRWNYRDQKDVEEVYAKFEEVSLLECL